MSVRTCLRAPAALLVSLVVLLPGLPATAQPVTAAPVPPVTASAPDAAAPVSGATTATSTREPASGGATYVVASGDTLTGIARAFGTPGGWPQLYAANRDAIGPWPDRLRPGTQLLLSGAPPVAQPADQSAQAAYAVARGDSLRSVAARLGVEGGWPALYAANRDAVGPDPDRLAVGTRLVLPASSAAGAPSADAVPPPAPDGGVGTRLGAAPETSSAAPVTPSAPAEPGRPAAPAAPATPATPGAEPAVPGWVVWPLVVVGVLAAAVLLGDPLVALLRRRRAATASGASGASRAARDEQQRAPLSLVRPVVDVGTPDEASPSAGAADAPAVHVAQHPTLLVSYSPADDLVLLLLPEEHDVDDVLQVARVALPERAYREVERRLPTPLRPTARGPVSARWAG
ncbi:LysM peptidoglycan-binding domain-containing protein [Quadrisphaera setariae]|uniref:LysM peptidoglycan-binding domain-containing protein n=1 Tax=Quadrisphaera setariae TaxID=2593304 RepID=A0A5C8ZHT0_9ACTN|nr:LysM domain-containing protein [Quadrisphaera setariae]TXR56430.1 LysM peptidoglycan-binding domain-containing protein [Quadrisphaera setariae]